MSLLRSLAAYLPPPDPRPMAEIEAEIREELEFHLEMSTSAGVEAGLSPEMARQEARARFGDVARIQRDCRRILVGDRLMLQRLHTVLTLLLFAAVVFLGVRFYRWQQASEAAQAQMLASLQELSIPRVVETLPATGATGVDPALRELRVVFSKPMLDQSWSWCIDPAAGPETTGQPHYLADGKTCVLPVKLQPGAHYTLSLNSASFTNFQDRDGRPAMPYLWEFSTRAP